ncbi:hypothetical protein, partial [Nocardiopsis sp. FIRDI 009]|uniref:hypothetical protein n=1 Tax=Nocardiopsis sp. FIRDI 009 TaxID=714197 RepID=UPI001E2FB299
TVKPVTGTVSGSRAEVKRQARKLELLRPHPVTLMIFLITHARPTRFVLRSTLVTLHQASQLSDG